MTSFKRSLYSHQYRPPHYRTPSPPIQSEIERLSPVSFKGDHVDDFRPRNGIISDGGERRSVPAQKRTWEDSTQACNGDHATEFRHVDRERERRHKSLGSMPGTSAMDAFATIALAMSDSDQYPMSHLGALSNRSFKQVKLQSPDEDSMAQPALGLAGGYLPASQPAKMRVYAPSISNATEQNPITNSAIPLTSTDDAELLLNVSRAVVLSPTTSRPTATQLAPLELGGRGHTSHVDSQSQPPVSHGSPAPPRNQSHSPPTPSEENHYGQSACLDQSETTDMSGKPIEPVRHPEEPSDERPSDNVSMNVSQEGQKHSECEPYVTNNSNVSMSREAPLPESTLIRRDDSDLVAGHDHASLSRLRRIRSKDDSQILRASSSYAKRRRGSAPEVFGGESTRTRKHSQELDRRVNNKLLPEQAAITGPLESIINPPVHPQSEMGSQLKGQRATCKGCRTLSNDGAAPSEDEEASWISCDGCKQWFHFACAGLTAKDVRSVDKFSCRDCWDSHGPTTYVRKSARTHTAIDYARLNEGVVKTSDDSPNHPYIKPIKERTIQFLPDTLPRVAPELITAEFFEKGNGMKEPIVIPATMNPQRKSIFESEDPSTIGSDSMDGVESSLPTTSQADLDTRIAQGDGFVQMPDHGQDKLDMVIPQGLTVRQVAELYGPQEKVDVIDVKSQESASWNLKKWADYYEGKSKKQIKNVISLEISTSKLGRLIKRPKVVRQLDLADSVWPPELKAKGDFPKVQLYCLMSVADSFTDFHIDFGGSSVFYHILKGKKTFLFIPPKNKHLKKYEQWCQSPVQQQTFLPDETKECYRVDLSAGDTMLIPSGWIHAVWTPEDSLVIGGNFLTRLHYGMQIQIAEIEKNTKVARKFRYPHFQKVLWLTAIKYLKDDPLPSTVEKSLQDGAKFVRDIPSYDEFDQWGPSSKPGAENYQARYYSQGELDGLPDLVRYLFRTALIATGKIVDGITADTRQRVARAIPKGHGEPLEVVRRLAMWTAWKRGNEHIPAWAYPNATIIDDIAKTGEKKLSAAAIKRLEREAAAEARRVVPQRQSQRKKGKALFGAGQIQQLDANIASTEDVVKHHERKLTVVIKTGKVARKRDASAAELEDHSIGNAKRGMGLTLTDSPASKLDGLIASPAKAPCLVCQEQGIECSHQVTDANNGVDPSESSKPSIPSKETSLHQVDQMVEVDSSASSNLFTHSSLQTEGESQITSASNGDISDPPTVIRSSLEEASLQEIEPTRVPEASVATTTSSEIVSGDSIPSSSRSSTSSGNNKRIRGNACQDCRKSKRRCVHSEDGIADPIKVKEAASKRSEYNLKRRLGAREGSEGSSNKRQKIGEGPVQEGDSNRDEPASEGVPAQLVNGISNDASGERQTTLEIDVSAPHLSKDTTQVILATDEVMTSISQDSSSAELVQVGNGTELPQEASHESITSITEASPLSNSGFMSSADVQGITECRPSSKESTKDTHPETSTILKTASTEQAVTSSSPQLGVCQTGPPGEIIPGVISQAGKEDEAEKTQSQEETKEEFNAQLLANTLALIHYVEPRSPTPEPLSEPPSPPSSPLSEIETIPSSPISTQPSGQQPATTYSPPEIPSLPVEEERKQNQEKEKIGRRQSSRPKKQPEFFTPPSSNPPANSTPPNHQDSRNNRTDTHVQPRSHKSSPAKARPTGKKSTLTLSTTVEKKRKAKTTSSIEPPPKKKAKTETKKNEHHVVHTKQAEVEVDAEAEKETMKLVREMAFGLRRR